MIAALNAPKVFLRLEQTAGGPAQDHLRTVPPFDPPGPMSHLGEAVLDDVGIG